MSLEKHLRKLVSFRTVTGDNAENKKALRYCGRVIKDSCKKLHVKWFSHEGYPSLVITTRKTKKPKVFLVGHMDVVPAPKHMWAAKKKGNRIYGRGVFDMKFAIASYLKIFENLGDDCLNYDLGLMLTSDEETGGFHGVKEFVKKQGYSAEVCVDPDGGEDWQVETWAKGLWQIEVISKGTSAHASRPWEGENAIDKLIVFIEDLRKGIGPNGSAKNFKNTFNLSFVAGGSATNQVPDEATARIDIRYPEEEELKRIIKTTQRVQKKYKQVKVKVLGANRSYKTSLEEPLIQEFISEMPKEHRNQKGSRSFGSSDAEYFSSEGVPVIVIRPKGGGLHSDNEWVDAKDLKRFHEALKSYVKKVARI